MRFKALHEARRDVRSTDTEGGQRIGFVALGVPIGYAEFMRCTLAAGLEEERRLLQELPELLDMQGAWLLLLYCASPRASACPLRTVPLLEELDRAVWATLQDALPVMLQKRPEVARRAQELALGGGSMRARARAQAGEQRDTTPAFGHASRSPATPSLAATLGIVPLRWTCRAKLPSRG